MAVTLPGALLARYPRFSLYNSPYPAHDRGRAIDLYPSEGAPSPVAGEVLDVRTVRAPPKPYSPEHDHLILVDCGEYVARILHVDPAVSPGDDVEIGDPLGTTIRAGFFAPWVDDHIHLGFRAPDANPYRASGSAPVELDCDVTPVAWDGTGRVNAVGETFVVLDSPAHPEPGERFAGIADDTGGTALDGGLPHYAGGGAFAGASGPLSVLGERVGTATGHDVEWDPIEVCANGEPITGISLFAGRETLGAKLVRPGHDFAIGERIEVSIRPVDAE
ncbi:hypothetical protein [Halalkalicoccus sp. NIPERK01]|uniref:hypothetical protein n=1 Tax=Halalkalicoccus sp. NIPERK01 TaxID=3053469 RepID=UPI00256F3F6B|nr:hypothetical protein [Halalkalicoccus sp. NIPERK01]MDL5362098.1 hypothetical protein [Halalkalicoccus sp. NIPERK01]